ncbi:MAG: PQQ-like beta-propeller repeat protein [Acidobacteria bacterium]|nr:PQQ-like beta-propeller repeat protein [Acidobacteriota bacterium]
MKHSEVAEAKRRGFSVRLLAACVLLLCAGAASGQRHLGYDDLTTRQVRLDLRDLGYPPIDVIPSDCSAIHALALAPSGKIYGATSGRQSHLFVFSPRRNYVQPLGRIPNTVAVHHALAVDADGMVYLGSTRPVDNNGEGYAGYEGGRLYRYDPTGEDNRPIQIERDCVLEDLGVMVRGEGIYAMLLDAPRRKIYGLTYPNGRFFVYDLATKTVAIKGAVAESFRPGENDEREKSIARALVADDEGNIYGSGEDGRLFVYEAATQRLIKLATALPAERARLPFVVIDSFAKDAQGNIYGGTSDGYLFRWLLKERRVINLGKAIRQYRVRGLVFGANGKLYGVGGEPGVMAHLFSYDPRTSEFDLLGFIDVSRRPYYSWQAYQADAMIAGDDGTIYIGQSERRSKLFVFYPW